MKEGNRDEGNEGRADDEGRKGKGGEGEERAARRERGTRKRYVGGTRERW